MKEKIIIFVIGILLGAVIATGAFYIYSKSNNQMNGGTPPDMPSGQMGDMQGGEPPAKPGENNTQSSN